MNYTVRVFNSEPAQYIGKHTVYAGCASREDVTRKLLRELEPRKIKYSNATTLVDEIMLCVRTEKERITFIIE